MVYLYLNTLTTSVCVKKFSGFNEAFDWCWANGIDMDQEELVSDTKNDEFYSLQSV